MAQPANPKEPPSNRDRQLGWAVVGLGKFATQQIIPSFSACKRSKLVALVSGSPDKAKRIAEQYSVDPKNIYNYQNYDSIRDNPEIDIVYIILPNALWLTLALVCVISSNLLTAAGDSDWVPVTFLGTITGLGGAAYCSFRGLASAGWLR